ncbi:S8 family peptidase [Kordia algicida OT-1]|uniref:Serine protease / subtilase peptidase n=1 Tax=Kordia algicida OT-1 TaxID=391587 RepID=A9DT97_9FLAO|nr:S8 family peptidase [Kordia algicida]EDP97043.1 Serine protease / subtilase peptidase [Kordia algicida OT-1]
MKIYNLIILSIMLLLSTSCKSQSFRPETSVNNSKIIEKRVNLTEDEIKNWQHKSFSKDTIFGISSELAYDFIEGKKGMEIIVAIIDLEVNINHRDLKNKIWINTDEIPNNNIDDDKNGYVDDINGWNFLGTKKNDPTIHHKSTAVRILKKYKHFKNLDESNIESKDLKVYRLYKRAEKYQKEKIEEAKLNLEYFQGFKERYLKLKDTMNVLFNKKDFTLEELDSLYKKNTDTIIKQKLASTRYLIKNGIDEKRINQILNIHKNNIEKTYNIEHFDRLTNDDLNDINDSIYGNNNVFGNAKMDHGTKVAGIIAANRDNEDGIIGIVDNIKIMPIIISSYGNENDKDIALAIRYAVNNGAKIINMSIGKEFSINEKWISDAIKYAEKKDVLIVSAAGNEGLNLDDKKNYYYPNDMDENKNEILNNFIAVGSSNYSNELISNYTNYGKKTVDIFAPGEDIKVLTWNGVDTDSGSSLSCAIVSGVVALIRSYFPNLNVIEVKNIILKSGISKNIMVYKPSPEGKEKDDNKVPFSSLSKSGKIVNAYNALLMAEEVSKKKKKKKRK